MATIAQLKKQLASGKLSQAQAEQIANQIRAQGGKVQLGNFGYTGGAKASTGTPTTSGGTGSSTGTGTPFVNPPDTGFKNIDKAGDKAAGVLGVGSSIGRELLPEVFEGGSGLDRTTFNTITPDKLSFNAINKYLAPSTQDAVGYRADQTSRYDELLGLNRDKLGGLNAAENQGLKESYYRPIDRERATALRDVARTPGLGAGASFAQRRALGRDYGDARLGAERQLLLDNVGVKRQALQDYGSAMGQRASVLGTAEDRVAANRGLQATARQNVDVGNVNNKLASDQFNSIGNFQSDQFNAGQQGKELAARVGAVATGTGLLGDERDTIAARKKKDELLAFLKERDESLFNQAQSLFG